MTGGGSAPATLAEPADRPAELIDHDALLNLALNHRRDGDLGAAEGVLRRTFDLHPQSPRAGVWLVRILVSRGRPDEAEAIARIVLERTADHADTLFELAQIRRQRGDLRQAAELFGGLIDLHPQPSRMGVWLARVLVEQGEPDQARQALLQVLENDPDHTDALLELGRLLRQQGDLAGAERAYLRLWTQIPPNPRAGVWLARLKLDGGHREEGADLLRQVLAAAPDHQEAMVRLGDHLASARQDAEALALYARAVAGPRPSDGAWLGLARVSARENSVLEAISVLETAQGQGAGKAIEISLVSHLLRAGRDADAKAAVEAALRRFPRDRRLLLLSVQLALLEGRFDAAFEQLARAPQATPADRLEVLRLRALLERARWRIDDALAVHAEIAGSEGARPEDHAAEALTRIIALDVAGARGQLRIAADKRGGRRANLSQGLLGEILNDISTHPQAAAAARQAWIGGETEAWLRLAGAYPNHTGCCMGLLTHLRQAGRLAIRPAGAGSAIPRRIHQFWDSGRPPTDVAELMGGWRAANPAWSYALYDAAHAQRWLKDNCGDDVWRAFRRCRTAAGKADILRLGLIWKEGGVYADADDRCARPLDELVEGRDLVLRQELFGSIGNNFLAAGPGHPVIGKALSLAVESILRGDRESVWLSTGPGLLTRVVAGFLAADPGRMDLLGREVVIADQHELRAYCVSGCQAAYKESRRAWQRIEFGVGSRNRSG